jgi:signal transduction histidine kinase/DNA-binding response OmpR family regulator/ligand-binding sensor domain-containing protein
MKRKSVNRTLLLFSLIICQALFEFNSVVICQPSNLRFDYFSIKDGLPDNGLRAVLQDHLGFLWIGTRNGLSKYDGYEFKNYSLLKEGSDDRIRNRIRFLIEDSKGDIWVALSTGGLAIFLRNEERFEFYFHEENNPNSLGDKGISTMLEDSKGNIWIGSWGDGLKFIDKQFILNKNSLLEFQHVEIIHKVEGINQVNDIYEDSENNLWVCTNNGLLCLSDSLNRLIQPVKTKFLNKKNFFICIEQDANGIFWIGTRGNGIAKYDKVLNEFEYFPYNEEIYKPNSLNNIHSILIDSKDNLWAGAFAGINTGLFLFNKATKQYRRFINDPSDPNSISEGSVVHSIIEDDVGNIWNTQGEGKLNKINPQKNLFQYYRDYKIDNDQIKFYRYTRMLIARDGKIWFASKNGLFEYLPKEDLFIKMKDKNESEECSIEGKCWSITEDSKGNLWTIIGEYRDKLINFNPDNKEVDCFEQIKKAGSFLNTYYTLEDENGMFWIATRGNGLDKWNPETNEIINFSYNPDNISSISNNFILRVCEDSTNSIWIATYNMNLDLYLNKINKETNHVKRIVVPRDIGYPHNLFVDSENRLWVGTTTGGILLFNTQDDSFTRITTEHGLPSNNFVTGFSEDHNGNIYGCTGSFIIKFNQDAEFGRSYEIAADDEVLYHTYYVKDTKEIYVISDRGFYRFFPDSLKLNPIPPRMVLTDMRIMDETIKVEPNSPLKSHINVAKNIVLQHWQNDFSIQYAAIHHINPSENKYKYILENYDTHWREAGKNRVAAYTNLSHGDYNFKVLGSNSDGVWATEPASLSIIILPPWWLTWWAYLVYVIIFIGTLSYLYYLQRKRLKVIHSLEMKEFETVKLREVDQMKSKFFANISHEFRTPLTLIKGPIERLLGNEKVDDPKKIYSMIKRNSEKLLNLINELLDLSKLESGKMKLSEQKGDIVSFTKAISMSFESLAQKKEIQLSISSSKDLIKLYFDKEKMQKILGNLLSNAFKFTQERGKITVKVAEDVYEQKVIITVADNGMGIPKEALPKIFDRFYQVENSKTDGNQGTGIGLSLTKELIEMHSGTIDVTSEFGKGTTLIIKLPIGPEHLQDDEIIYEDIYEPTKDIEYENEKSVKSSLGKEKPLVLVVEDNIDVQNFIKEIIEEKYRFVDADDGKEGYEKALEDMPDLIISDIMMPKIPGDQMCERLKKNQITSHIPIILLTAKASGEDKISGLKIGADDYLIKPFDEKELLARINNLIAQRRNLREKYLREAEIHPIEVAVTSVDKKFIEKVIKLIEQNLSQSEFSIEQFAEELAMSRAQLYRKFASILGEKPNEFVRKYRIKRAAELIKQNFGNIAQVAYEVGFNNLSYFSKCFKTFYKISPHEYQHKLSKK